MNWKRAIIIWLVEHDHEIGLFILMGLPALLFLGGLIYLASQV